MFVTPESAVSKTFAGYVNRLQEMHQLDRIVIDECHTILDGRSSFRPKLRQLEELSLLEAQMVYLTATLPPQHRSRYPIRREVRVELETSHYPIRRGVIIELQASHYQIKRVV